MSTENVIGTLQEHNVLALQMICYFCSDNMRERSKNDVINSKVWQCVNYNFYKFKKKYSVLDMARFF